MSKFRRFIISQESHKLLFIEDDPDQREILSLVFRAEGFEVVCSNNGKEALDILDKDSFSLIVCDYMMPVMNGEEFLINLRKSEINGDIPVLMLTAADSESVEKALLEAGADDHCSKSLKRAQIVERIRNLIQE